MVTRIPVSEPRRTAAAMLAIIGQHGFNTAVSWIEVPADVFTAADMRAAADLPGRGGLVTGVAGWVAIVTAPDKAELDMTGDSCDTPDTFMFPGGVRRHIHDLARSALHLSQPKANWLFDTGRTRSELVAAMESLAAGLPAADREIAD